MKKSLAILALSVAGVSVQAKDIVDAVLMPK
jgi:hypothetical protein